ncbi:MAG: hypothetical protein ACI4VI_02110 [Acutalibacteraceae bacterium]
MVSNYLVNLMQNNDKQAIIEGLSHKGAIYRINGIIYSVLFSHTENETVSIIQNLKTDTTLFDGYSVSDFAIAALDLLSVEKYKGNEETILKLINSKFEF